MGTRDQQIATDITFRCPAATLAGLLASQGAPAWLYEFNAAPGGGMIRHALEIGYAFGALTFGRGLSLKPYWLNFAKTGNPNATAFLTGPGTWRRRRPRPGSATRSDGGRSGALGNLLASRPHLGRERRARQRERTGAAKLGVTQFAPASGIEQGRRDVLRMLAGWVIAILSPASLFQWP